MGHQTVTFGQNSTSESAAVSIPEDSIIEDAEGFQLVLLQPSVGSISNSSGIVRGVIVDNDGTYQYCYENLVLPCNDSIKTMHFFYCQSRNLGLIQLPTFAQKATFLNRLVLCSQMELHFKPESLEQFV